MNNNHNILPEDFDDLSKHAPLLHALRGKAEGFVVPENYFGDAGELISGKTVLPATDGFEIPEHYFEELAKRILALVQLPSKENDFTVPENYFEDFTDKISSLINLDELKNKNDFEIPKGYFEEFDNELPTKLALDNIKQDDGFVVPEGYFEKLSAKVIAQASLEELHTGSDADVPEGYFNSLADRIAQRIENEEGITKKESKEKGRIIVFAEFVQRYAKPVSLAASAALLIAVSIWFLNRDTEKPVQGFANNTPVKNKTIVPPVVPVDTTTVRIPENKNQENKIAVQPVKTKNKKPLNPAPVRNVKVEKQDVMDQMDLIDETTVAEYISDQSPANEEKVNDDFLNDAMEQYLLDDNADPSTLYNDGQNRNFKE